MRFLRLASVSSTVFGAPCFLGLRVAGFFSAVSVSGGVSAFFLRFPDGFFEPYPQVSKI